MSMPTRDEARRAMELLAALPAKRLIRHEREALAVLFTIAEWAVGVEATDGDERAQAVAEVRIPDSVNQYEAARNLYCFAAGEQCGPRSVCCRPGRHRAPTARATSDDPLVLAVPPPSSLQQGWRALDLSARHTGDAPASAGAMQEVRGAPVTTAAAPDREAVRRAVGELADAHRHRHIYGQGGRLESLRLKHSDLLVALAEHWLARGPASDEGASPWRPMATAPRNGTPVLVDFGDRGVHQVAWTSPQDHDFEIWCVDDGKFGPFPLRRYVETDVRGWMPTPAATPAAGEKEDE